MIEQASESSRGLGKTPILGPHPRVFDSVGQEGLSEEVMLTLSQPWGDLAEETSGRNSLFT